MRLWKGKLSLLGVPTYPGIANLQVLRLLELQMRNPPPKPNPFLPYLFFANLSKLLANYSPALW